MFQTEYSGLIEQVPTINPNEDDAKADIAQTPGENREINTLRNHIAQLREQYQKNDEMNDEIVEQYADQNKRLKTQVSNLQQDLKKAKQEFKRSMDNIEASHLPVVEEVIQTMSEYGKKIKDLYNQLRLIQSNDVEQIRKLRNEVQNAQTNYQNMMNNINNILPQVQTEIRNQYQIELEQLDNQLSNAIDTQGNNASQKIDELNERMKRLYDNLEAINDVTATKIELSKESTFESQENTREQQYRTLLDHLQNRFNEIRAQQEQYLQESEPVDQKIQTTMDAYQRKIEDLEQKLTQISNLSVAENRKLKNEIRRLNNNLFTLEGQLREIRHKSFYFKNEKQEPYGITPPPKVILTQPNQPVTQVTLQSQTAHQERQLRNERLMNRQRELLHKNQLQTMKDAYQTQMNILRNELMDSENIIADTNNLQLRRNEMDIDTDEMPYEAKIDVANVNEFAIDSQTAQQRHQMNMLSRQNRMLRDDLQQSRHNFAQLQQTHQQNLEQTENLKRYANEQISNERLNSKMAISEMQRAHAAQIAEQQEQIQNQIRQLEQELANAIEVKQNRKITELTTKIEQLQHQLQELNAANENQSLMQEARERRMQYDINFYQNEANAAQTEQQRLQALLQELQQKFREIRNQSVQMTTQENADADKIEQTMDAYEQKINQLENKLRNISDVSLQENQQLRNDLQQSQQMQQRTLQAANYYRNFARNAVADAHLNARMTMSTMEQAYTGLKNELQQTRHNLNQVQNELQQKENETAAPAPIILTQPEQPVSQITLQSESAIREQELQQMEIQRNELRRELQQTTEQFQNTIEEMKNTERHPNPDVQAKIDAKIQQQANEIIQLQETLNQTRDTDSNQIAALMSKIQMLDLNNSELRAIIQEHSTELQVERTAFDIDANETKLDEFVDALGISIESLTQTQMIERQRQERENDAGILRMETENAQEMQRIQQIHQQQIDALTNQLTQTETAFRSLSNGIQRMEIPIQTNFEAKMGQLQKAIIAMQHRLNTITERNRLTNQRINEEIHTDINTETLQSTFQQEKQKIEDQMMALNATNNATLLELNDVKNKLQEQINENQELQTEVDEITNFEMPNALRELMLEVGFSNVDIDVTNRMFRERDFGSLIRNVVNFTKDIHRLEQENDDLKEEVNFLTTHKVSDEEKTTMQSYGISPEFVDKFIKALNDGNKAALLDLVVDIVDKDMNKAYDAAKYIKPMHFEKSFYDKLQELNNDWNFENLIEFMIQEITKRYVEMEEQFYSQQMSTGNEINQLQTELLNVKKAFKQIEVFFSKFAITGTKMRNRILIQEQRLSKANAKI